MCHVTKERPSQFRSFAMEDLIALSFVDEESILRMISALEKEKDVGKEFEKEVIDVSMINQHL